MCDVESLLRPPPRPAAKKPSWTTPLPHLAWHLKLIWPFIYWQILILEKFLRTHFPGTPTYIYRITDFGRVLLIRHPGDALAPSRRDTAVRAPEPPEPDAPFTILSLDTHNPPWAADFAARVPGLSALATRASAFARRVNLRAALSPTLAERARAPAPPDTS